MFTQLSSEKKYGLFFKYKSGIDPELKGMCIEFGKWLREKNVFSKKLIINILNSEHVINRKGEAVYGTFFGPYDKDDTPIIKIASGDYQQCLISYGRDSAIEGILDTIAHEVTHYFQWLNDRPYLEKEAKENAKKLVNNFYDHLINNTNNMIIDFKKHPTKLMFSRLLKRYNKNFEEGQLNIIECIQFLENPLFTKKWLLSLIGDRSANIRAASVVALRDLEGEDLTNPLIKTLYDDDEIVKIFSIQTLGILEIKEAIPYLINFLSNKNELIRGNAAVALGQVDAQFTKPYLVQILKTENRNAARLRFYVALYLLGEKQYFQYIIKCLKSRSYLVRYGTISYLVDLIDEDNKSVILTKIKELFMCEKRSEVKEMAQDAIEEIVSRYEYKY